MEQQDNLKTYTTEEIKGIVLTEDNFIFAAPAPPILPKDIIKDLADELKLSIELTSYANTHTRNLIQKALLEQLFGEQKAEEIQQGRGIGMIYITMDSGAEAEDWDRKISDRVIKGLKHLEAEGFIVERFDKVVEERTQKRIITISRAKQEN